MSVSFDLLSELLEGDAEKYDVFFGKLDEILHSAYREHYDEIEHVSKVRSILSRRSAGSNYNYSDYDESSTIIEDDEDSEYLSYNQLEEEVYDHTLSTNYEVFCDSLYNIILPRNVSVIDIEKKGSRLLEDLGIPDFITDSNYAWVNIIDAVNDKHSLSAKYNKIIRESAAYGRSGAYHYFKPDELFADLRSPGILNMKRTPLAAPRDCQIQIVKDHIDYSMLKGDSEINQELLSAIMPGQELYTYTKTERTSRRSADVLGYDYDLLNPATSKSDYPFGTLPVHIIYVPYFYVYTSIDDEFGEMVELEYKKLFLWVVFDANFKPNVDIEEVNGGKPHVILKAKLLETQSECEIVECNFTEVLPEENYSDGLIANFLGDHNLLNTMRVGLAKIGDYISDPAWQAIKRDALGNTSLNIDRIESGAIYDQGFDFSALIHDNVDKQLMALKEIKVDVKRDIQDATAINPTTSGNMPGNTSETAAAVNTRMERFDVRQESPARQFDDEFMKRSHYVRILLTQNELRRRIREKFKILMENPEDPDQDPFELFNKVLDEDELFTRLMDYSQLEFSYKEFYDAYQAKMSKEENQMNEYEALSQEYLSTLAFAQMDVTSPVVPEKQIDEAGNEFFLANNVPQQWTDKNLNSFLENELDMQMQDKEIALQKSKEIRQNMKVLEGTFEGLPPIPQPNNLLFFEILTDPIQDTDLTVIGSDTALHRKEKIENSDRLAGMANARPEFNNEINWQNGLKDVARAMGLKLKTWFKTTKQKQRDEILMRQQQAEMQQMPPPQEQRK